MKFLYFPFFTDCCLMDIYSTFQYFSVLEMKILIYWSKSKKISLIYFNNTNVVQSKNIGLAIIGYIVRFRHLSKCKPQMTLSTGNYYDVIFLPNDTDLHGKRTRIWEYSNFIGHGFVGRHRFEERTQI